MDGSIQEQLRQLGAELRHARIKAAINQTELAQRAGVSRQLVSRIENGLNAEMGAYLAVINALHRRVRIVEEAAATPDDLAALDLMDELSQPPGGPAARPRQS
jgi:transcriptional regulator with XRE-family HTH domain